MARIDLKMRDKIAKALFSEMFRDDEDEYRAADAVMALLAEQPILETEAFASQPEWVSSLQVDDRVRVLRDRPSRYALVRLVSR